MNVSQMLKTMYVNYGLFSEFIRLIPTCHKISTLLSQDQPDQQIIILNLFKK
jgi:hypothetical protein